MSELRRAMVLGKRLLAQDRGFSIPELIVAISLLALLMTVVVTLFTSFTRNFTEERAATDSTNVAGLGMNDVTRVIRAGTTIDRITANDLPVFVAATRESVTLYSYLAEDSMNPAPIRVNLSIDSGRQLIEKRWNATRVNDEWIFPALTATPASTRVVARKLVAPTVAQIAAGERYLFTYLTNAGAEMAAPVASTNLGNIAAVKVTMVVQADETARAAPVKLQNRVGIPNLTTSRLGLQG